MDGMVITNKFIGSIKAPKICSWIWSKIVKLRDKAEPVVKHVIREKNRAISGMTIGLCLVLLEIKL